MRNSIHRPVFLNLLRIHLPITGLVSILHRITGMIWVLLLPPMMYFLHLSLENESGFDETVRLMSGTPARLVILFILWLFLQHFFSGLRHLLLDLDMGVTLNVARRSAVATLLASALLTVLAGARLF